MNVTTLKLLIMLLDNYEIPYEFGYSYNCQQEQIGYWVDIKSKELTFDLEERLEL